MMPEISLNILDVAENSTRAQAQLTEISVACDFESDCMTVVIRDDGCGMTPEQVAHVTDPFFTTRKTRRIGLGVPFFKLSAEQTGGSFSIESVPGEGTCVTAVFVISSIDRMPLGDIAGTMQTLAVMHPECDFLFSVSCDGKDFSLDTREVKEALGGVPLSEPEVASWLSEALSEGVEETLAGRRV